MDSHADADRLGENRLCKRIGRTGKGRIKPRWQIIFSWWSCTEASPSKDKELKLVSRALPGATKDGKCCLYSMCFLHFCGISNLSSWHVAKFLYSPAFSHDHLLSKGGAGAVRGNAMQMSPKDSPPCDVLTPAKVTVIKLPAVCCEAKACLPGVITVGND